MDAVRRRQRGSAGWAVVVDRWRTSGLSVEMFCRRDGINRASFYRWRALLAASEPAGLVALDASPRSRTRPLVSAENSAVPAADFVDLGVLGQSAPGGRLELRLDLGAGLVLTLVRS